MGYLIVFMIMAGCALSLQQKSEPLKLLSADAQEQRAGAHGGGSSKDYTFAVLVATDKKIVFDSVWVEGHWLGVRVEKEGHLLRKDEQISQKDTLILHASFFMPAEAESGSLPEPVTTKPPINFAGKAIVRYYIDGKPGYFPVTDIRELPPLIMP